MLIQDDSGVLAELDTKTWDHLKLISKLQQNISQTSQQEFGSNHGPETPFFGGLFSVFFLVFQKKMCSSVWENTSGIDTSEKLLPPVASLHGEPACERNGVGQAAASVDLTLFTSTIVIIFFSG